MQSISGVWYALFLLFHKSNEMKLYERIIVKILTVSLRCAIVIIQKMEGVME